jgi:beta-1,2-mannobiose phosphorylase / 1,2-beta-oligomannan phosphorylase
MITRLKFKTLLSPEDVKPTREDMKVIGVFNPAAIRVNNDEIVLMVRVAETCVSTRDGHFFSPKYIRDGDKTGLHIECFPVVLEHDGDVRKFLDDRGFMRLAFISHLRMVKLDSSGFNVTFIDNEPTFVPENIDEEYGVEDPRLEYINGRYYMTYVGVSKEMGITTALASTTDFKNFTRHGIIFNQENKDVIVMPEKFKKGYCAIHRPVARHQFASPNMQVAFSPDLFHWGQHKLLITARPGKWDGAKIGGGTNVVKTEKGWLEIYHGVEKIAPHDPIGVYKAGALLLDLEDPSKVLARSKVPILSPDEDAEKEGFVRNVIFPTGAVMDKDGENLILYSGGADTFVTATQVSMREIFDSLEYV